MSLEKISGINNGTKIHIRVYFKFLPNGRGYDFKGGTIIL